MPGDFSASRLAIYSSTLMHDVRTKARLNHTHSPRRLGLADITSHVDLHCTDTFISALCVWFHRHRPPRVPSTTSYPRSLNCASIGLGRWSHNHTIYRNFTAFSSVNYVRQRYVKQVSNAIWQEAASRFATPSRRRMHSPGSAVFAQHTDRQTNKQTHRPSYVRYL